MMKKRVVTITIAPIKFSHTFAENGSKNDIRLGGAAFGFWYRIATPISKVKI